MLCRMGGKTTHGGGLTKGYNCKYLVNFSRCCARFDSALALLENAIMVKKRKKHFEEVCRMEFINISSKYMGNFILAYSQFQLFRYMKVVLQMKLVASILFPWLYSSKVSVTLGSCYMKFVYPTRASCRKIAHK